MCKGTWLGPTMGEETKREKGTQQKYQKKRFREKRPGGKKGEESMKGRFMHIGVCVLSHGKNSEYQKEKLITLSETDTRGMGLKKEPSKGGGGGKYLKRRERLFKKKIE